MRRLTAMQPVTINLDSEDEGIDCHVLVVSGPVALLHPLSDVEPIVRTKLARGSPCMLAFTHEGALVGLRGIATAAAEDLSQLAFVVSDGVQVEERRVAERIPLATRARAATATGDATAVDDATAADNSGSPALVETLTADISLGGVRIERTPEIGDGPHFRLELFFPGEPEPVSCVAELARATPTHLGLRFSELPSPERLRLARILADHQLRGRPV